MVQKEWKKIGDQLYRRRGLIYWRSQVGGHRSWVRLEAKTLREARSEIGKLIHNQRPTSPWLIDLLNFYLSSDCPKRNEQPRTGRQLAMEQSRVSRLKKYFTKNNPASITHATLRAYRGWRGQTRACELDIATLAAACRWAYRNPDQTGITSNPMPTDRPRFASPQKHCRDRQPTDATQLHRIAYSMMQDSRSEVFGWMTLFLAFTGIRIGRAREFRVDASNHNPGHFDGECIWVGVSQTHKGVFPFIKVHDALQYWWDGFQRWRISRGVSSPWYFYSPSDPTKPVGAQSLEHAMRRVCGKLGIQKCSPHGLRSYYVNVLRSQGIMDSEIALRVGHRSGGKLIVDVYGEIKPTPITFLPPKDSLFDLVTTSVTTSRQGLLSKVSVTKSREDS